MTTFTKQVDTQLAALTRGQDALQKLVTKIADRRGPSAVTKQVETQLEALTKGQSDLQQLVTKVAKSSGGDSADLTKQVETQLDLLTKGQHALQALVDVVRKSVDPALATVFNNPNPEHYGNDGDPGNRLKPTKEVDATDVNAVKATIDAETQLAQFSVGVKAQKVRAHGGESVAKDVAPLIKNAALVADLERYGSLQAVVDAQGHATAGNPATIGAGVGGTSGGVLLPQSRMGPLGTQANVDQGKDARFTPIQKQRIETVQRLDKAAKELREIQLKDGPGVCSPLQSQLGEQVYKAQRELQIEAGVE